MPSDYYAIYKNITKYTYINLNSILEYLNLENHKQLNQRKIVFDYAEFRLVKKGLLQKNLNNFGIPQGSAISAVLSNIYMFEIDKKINDYVTSRGGLYRRYSDDIIIVLPLTSAINDDWCFLASTLENESQIKLEQKKTKTYKYRDNTVTTIPSEKRTNINYLGFEFNGDNIKIRDRTISKFYHRMYRKIDAMNKQYQYTKVRVPRKKLYKMYSSLGAKQKDSKKGNFITYVLRVKSIMGNEISTLEAQSWIKMQKRLQKKL